MQLVVLSGRVAMTRAAPLLLALLLLTGCPSGASITILCSWTQVSPGGELHRSFLRSAPPRLYHAVWSRERALLGCAWSDDAAVVSGYASLCAERTHNFSHHAEPRVEALLEAEERCAPLDAQERTRGRAPGGGHGRRSEVRGHQRVKRGFIVPGTLWCGSGNKAPSYEDLGVFSATDSCCREHDQCKDTILSFHSQFGVFNSNIFTMSHCDCDNKFRSCLKEANDSMADVVGYTFFNLLKMQCFQFSHRLQCSQRNWFGLCKESKMALYAQVYLPTLYETPDPAGGDANTTDFSINSTTAANVTESSSWDPQLLAITPSPPGPPSPTRTNTAHYGTSSVGPPGPPGPSEPTRPPGLPAEGSYDVENLVQTPNQTMTEQDSDFKAIQGSCGALRHLDECKDVILPRQRKFGLDNPDPRSLYHCNCTSRLFQTVARQQDLSPVRTVLMRHVAPSCFLPQDCSGCGAVLLEVELPSLGLSRASSSRLEEWRPLRAVEAKVRRRNWRRTRRKQEAATLQRLCVRLQKRRGRVA